MTLEDIMLAKPGYLERLAKRGIGDIAKVRRETEEELIKKAKEEKKETIKLMLKSGTPYENISNWLKTPIEDIAEIDNTNLPLR